MTATLPGTIDTVTWGRLHATYSVHGARQPDGVCLDLPSYKQQDVHSCGFIAALTVARYFDVTTDARKVLKVVRPSINWGTSRFQLLDALASLGITSHYRTNLTAHRLHQLVQSGYPIILSVWPDQWINDHWTVLRGFSACRQRVYLTNYKSLPIGQFLREWSDMDKRGQGNSREGIVCSQ